MEEYLQQIHAENYTGTDDDMPDSFEAYLANLSVDEWIKLSDKYAEHLAKNTATIIRQILEN